jgi:hypothetical protein
VDGLLGVILGEAAHNRVSVYRGLSSTHENFL